MKAEAQKVFLKARIESTAKKEGWTKGIEEKGQVWFSKDGVTLVFILRTRAIITHMQHPKRKTPTILQREGLYIKEIESILRDPRTHTGKGKIITTRKK